MRIRRRESLPARRDGLVVRWLPDLDHRVHERTEIGCANCGKWFSGREDQWAIARWNMFAVTEWEKRGVVLEHAELARLLFESSEAEERARFLRGDIDSYLAKHIPPTCPFSHGDRFISERPPRGVWSVRNVRAVYGYNTGPFWIVEAQSVLSSGRLGDKHHEFWQEHQARLKVIPPYWKSFALVPGCRKRHVHDGWRQMRYG